jgi:anti-sigma-K factor RskA
VSDPTRPADSGAYVLNALSESERNNFEAQLASSEQLRNEVTELTDTAVLLGLAVEPVAPSARLRGDIMAMIATTPQLSRDDRAAPGLHPIVEEPPVKLGTVTRLSWYRRPAVVLTSAAVAVVLILGGVFGSTAVVQSIQASQQADALAAINAAPDEQHAAASVATGGTATLVWSLSLGKSALIVNGLTALPNNKTYELWYINAKGTPIEAGLIQASGGHTWRVLDGTMARGDTVGVTVEPSGGSKAPTTTPIVAIASA